MLAVLHIFLKPWLKEHIVVYKSDFAAGGGVNGHSVPLRTQVFYFAAADNIKVILVGTDCIKVITFKQADKSTL